MKDKSGLAAAYCRRAFWIRAGRVAPAVGMTLLLTGALAQDNKPAKGTTDTTPAKSAKPGKAAAKNSSLHVIPMSQGKDSKAAVVIKPSNSAPPPAPMPGAAVLGSVPGTVAGGGAAFTFDFHGSDIDNVLKFYAQVSNLTVAKDPGLTGPVTIICPKPITLDDAFKVLQSVLSVRGFTALQSGAVLSIVPLDKGVTSTTLVNPDTSDRTKIDPRNQVMTQVIPLDNVDAEAIAKELTPLITKGASLVGSPGTNALILTDTASNVERFIKLVDALDKSSNTAEIRVFPLRRSEAPDIVDTINGLFKQITTRGRGAGAQPGQPPPQPLQPGQQAPLGNGRAAVVAVADQRTNSVIAVASQDNLRKIAELIARLDDDDSSVMETEIRKILYADADRVASLVNSVLSNLHRAGGAAGGQGGSPFQQRVFGGFGGFDQGNSGGGSVSSTDPFGKVVSDPRTNTVIITATSDRMAKIKELIDEIDKDVPVETTTFVIPLKNAQADDVAYALSQAFSTGQNNSNPFGNTFFFGGGGNQGNGSQRRQRIQRRLGQSNNNNNGFGRAASKAAVPPGPPNAPDGSAGGDVQGGADSASASPDGIQGVMTADGFVPTQTDKTKPTRQYYYGDYYGYGGGRRGLGQSRSPQYGRGREGGYVNLLQLQNNVFVTAAPGGDSLIVTTTPDNYKTVKELIDALDVVPRQVLIEVIVAEVTLDTDKKLGFALGGKIASLFGKPNTAQIQTNLPAANAGTTFDATVNGFQGLISATNYSALLQALTTDSKVKVLSTPSVFTGNNEEAEIDITTKVPYISGQQSNGFISTTVSNNVEFIDVGYILNVVPRITRQGMVTIEVQQEASDLLRYDTLGTGTSAIRAPVVNDRYADTAVTVQDGETIVVGGLIRDSKALNISKVPILSEIPLLGQFFRSRETTRNKVELMIFLTPHVISSVDEARRLTLEKGAPVIRQIPDLPAQYPKLDLKNLPKATKPTKDSAPGAPTGSSTGSGTPTTGSDQK